MKGMADRQGKERRLPGKYLRRLPGQRLTACVYLPASRGAPAATRCLPVDYLESPEVALTLGPPLWVRLNYARQELRDFPFFTPVDRCGGGKPISP